MQFSNYLPGEQNIGASVCDSSFAGESSSTGGGSSWSGDPEWVRRSTLRSRTATSREKNPWLREGSILLIEDNPADAGLVREALEEHGLECEFLVIADGDKAIRFVEALDAGTADAPDVVIVDLNLPRRPGREVLEAVRHSVKCSRATVVILSSSYAAEDRADAARLGVDDYILKPLRLDEFLELGARFKTLFEAARRRRG